ncbi:unnamed protein product [Thlaspi arvense]|uniref:Cytochrome P450 n=1 Tax=Thlaspi arvense TaxID=13288 RepID=A0AAU9S1C1_THLAR|nr:unnamed protein product [Thlaspi arvense]
MAAMITIDFQNCTILLLLCIFSLLCYSLFFKKPKNSRGYDNLPPSPPSLPIIGHLHLLLSTLTHKSFQKISSKYGPLLHLRVFNVRLILVSSASVADEIFRLHDVNVSSRNVSTIDESLVFGSSGFITAPYGDYWKFMKKLVATKLLRPQAIEQSRGVRAEELERLYANLLNKAKKNESIDIGKEAMKLTNNTICRMSMGRSCSENNGEAERLRELVTKSFALTKKIFFANLLHSVLGISVFKTEIMGVSREFDELLEGILVKHEEKPEENQGKDMMDLLLEAYRDEKAEYNITRNHIKSFLLEIFLAGTDTSTQTTQWTMAEIVSNPSILAKLREEIDSVVGKTRMIQESDLPNLPYLQVVVKEGLRMHPPSPFLLRTFRESCEIKGFYVPENTVLFVNAYALMRDPNSWKDPDEFKPERFLASSGRGEENEVREQVMKYLPFGAGRRGCPGTSLGYIFLGTMIGMMVQCFDWKIEGGKVHMEEAVAGMNLAMAHPPKCTPVSRFDPFTINLHKS